MVGGPGKWPGTEPRAGEGATDDERGDVNAGCTKDASVISWSGIGGGKGKGGWSM